MTLQQMLDMAELYLYEVGKNGREVVPAQMVLLFNRAQDRLISMLNRNIVRDLDVTVTGQSLAPGGGFILAPVTNIRADTPRAWRNVEALIDEWRLRRGGPRGS